MQIAEQASLHLTIRNIIEVLDDHDFKHHHSIIRGTTTGFLGTILKTSVRMGGIVPNPRAC
jgi:hypothetical protein